MPFPILSAKDIDDFSNYTDKQIIKYSTLQDLSNKFIGLLQGDFTDLTINTSLQEWYNLDWTNFMNLLKKQKIILNGALKDDWYDRFNRFKQQAVELKSIIENIPFLQIQLFLKQQDTQELKSQHFAISRISMKSVLAVFAL